MISVAGGNRARPPSDYQAVGSGLNIAALGFPSHGGYRAGRRRNVPTEAEMAAARQRHEFESAVSLWSDELGRLAFLLSGDPDAADDLLAECLLAAWLQWSKVQAADNPKAYVRRMVVNKAASRVRRLVRQRSAFQLLAAAPPVVSTDIDTTVDLGDALDSLPTRQRQCLVLRYGMDLSVAEVADILGVSTGSVKSNSFKGAANLRKLLEDASTDRPSPAEVGP